MNTRNEHNPGYYTNLVKGIEYENYCEEKCKEAKKEININSLIKLINYNVIKKLKSNRKSAPTCHSKFVIENKVFNYLKNCFKFNSRFKESNEFLLKYNLERERCQNERYYSIASNFEFKINKGRKIKFNQLKDGKVVSREITSNHTLSVSFFINNFP